MVDVFNGKYQAVLDRLSLKSEDVDNQWRFIPNALRYAQIYMYIGDNQKAKKYYGQAVDILKSKTAVEPNDARYQSFLGIAYAGLGRKDDAIREGKRAVDLDYETAHAIRLVGPRN